MGRAHRVEPQETSTHEESILVQPSDGPPRRRGPRTDAPGGPEAAGPADGRRDPPRCLGGRDPREDRAFPGPPGPRQHLLLDGGGGLALVGDRAAAVGRVRRRVDVLLRAGVGGQRDRGHAGRPQTGRDPPRRHGFLGRSRGDEARRLRGGRRGAAHRDGPTPAQTGSRGDEPRLAAARARGRLRGVRHALRRRAQSAAGRPSPRGVRGAQLPPRELRLAGQLVGGAQLLRQLVPGSPGSRAR